MKLKDALCDDASAVFLNPDEFGEEVMLDGQSVMAVMEEVQFPETGEWGDGLQRHMREMWMGHGPRVVAGQSVTLNGEAWLVASVQPEMGLLRLRLERRQAWGGRA